MVVVSWLGFESLVFPPLLFVEKQLKLSTIYRKWFKN